MFDLICKYYELFFSYVSGNRDFVFNPKTQSKQITNFIALLDKQIGVESVDEDFIFNFIAFQFERKRDQRTRFGKGIVMLNHVIGRKALDRWERKSDNWYYHTDRFCTEYCIPKYIKQGVVTEREELPISEEVIREISHKKDLGVAYCIDLTTLYHPKSQFCVKCKTKIECQEVQLDFYPELYNKRKFM